MTGRRPKLLILAGPNGAGKSTLYRAEIQPRFPSAEFVNADLIGKDRFGAHVTTLEQTKEAQRLAEERRRTLMAERKDLVTESTFSHPSKVDLVREALAMGYDVRIYHVNLRSDELAVKRVARRVDQGGHPVPESKTRERYARNQPLIREAALLANRASAFDNSEFGRPPVRILTLVRGRATFVSDAMPPWARTLYAPELLAYAPERLNRPASSFAGARSLVAKLLGDKALLYVAKTRDGRYDGPAIAETDMHLVQRIGSTLSCVAHFKSNLTHVPVVGDAFSVHYVQRRGHVALVRDRTPDNEAPLQTQPKSRGRAR